MRVLQPLIQFQRVVFFVSNVEIYKSVHRLARVNTHRFIFAKQIIYTNPIYLVHQIKMQGSDIPLQPIGPVDPEAGKTEKDKELAAKELEDKQLDVSCNVLSRAWYLRSSYT